MARIKWVRVLFGVVLVFAAIALGAQSTVWAQEATGTRPDYRWTHFTSAPDGLASNDVWAVLALDDAVWFGTEMGVSRYDGAWTNFPAGEGTDSATPAAGRMLEGPVLAMAPANSGGVWAANAAGDVAHWDGVTWTLAGRAPGPVRALAEWQGQLFVGAADGVYRLESDTMVREPTLPGYAVHALHVQGEELWAGAEGGLWRRSADGWRRHEETVDFFSQGVYALGAVSGGDLAAGTARGLAIRRGPHGTWQFLPVRDETGRSAAVQALASDGAGRLWAGSDGAGALEIAADALQAEEYGPAGRSSLTTRFVRGVAVDADGSIWFATPAGVFRFQARMWRTDIQGVDAADSRNYVNDLLVDREGALWIATGGGGIRVKRPNSVDETVFGVQDGIPSTVLVLAEDSTGAVWAGSFAGAFRYSGGAWNQPIPAGSLPSVTVTALLAEGPLVWVGTEAGLLRYDTRDESVQAQDTFAEQSIEALLLDARGRLWVGTQQAGLYERDPDGRWIRHVHDPDNPDSIPGNWIIGSGLAADWRGAGRIWAIVFREGLAYWDGAAWTDGDPDGQVSSNLMWTLEAEADAGMLWIGSEAGVTRFDGRTWGNLTPEDGLHTAVVHAFAKTDEGTWIGGPTGLSLYVPDQSPPWVRIGGFTGIGDLGPDGAIHVPVGEPLQVTFAAGDLQTPQAKLKMLLRRTGPGQTDEWVEISPGAVQAEFGEPGAYALEVVARDLSFNYSQPAVQEIVVFVPPPTVPVPGLGEVVPEVFKALVVLGLISVLGTGYLLFELLQHRQRSIDALNRSFNPYISGEPVRRNEMFYARRNLVQRMFNMLHNNSIMIHGERRIGKTSLLFQLMAAMREANDADYWFVPIYVDLEGTPQETFFHFLMEEVVEGILWLPHAREEILPELNGLRYNKAQDGYSDRDFSRDLRQVIDVLGDYGRQREGGRQLRLILLLDEMDVMSTYDHLVQQQLRRIFMREFATTVGAVVAGIRINKEWDRVESPWYNLFNEFELEPFTPDEALELLVEPVHGYYRYEPEAIEFILDHAGGRPYRVQQYGLEAVNQMLAHRRRKIVLADVLAAHDRIEAAAGGDR